MRLLLLSLTVVLFAFSCENEEKNARKLKISKADIEESIEEINKENIEIEDRQIDDYLERRSWEFNQTKTGLRYNIYSEGYGISPEKGDVVVLEYSVSLIRGEEIYNSENDGNKIFKIGKSDEPSGLHEAALLLKTGAKAKVILPSYLGYGVTGDDAEIPMNATLIYDLHLIEVRK